MAATLGNTFCFGGVGAAAFTTGGLATGLGASFAFLLTSGLATDFAATGLAAGFTTAFLAAGLETGLASGFAAFFATGPVSGLVAFFGATLTAGLAIFFKAAAGRFTSGLATLCLLSTGFGAAFLATGFLTTTFFAGGPDRTEGLTDFDTAGFATFLDATFTDFPPSAAGLAVFVTPAPEAPFFKGALATAELRVVFAMSFTIMVWRRGVIAQMCYPSNRSSGILTPYAPIPYTATTDIVTRLIIFLLSLYKRWLSPLLGQRCRFHPSCSDYARIAIARFGPFQGGVMTVWRLLRCQPLCEGGADPVPEHFTLRGCGSHGEHK